MWGTQDLGANSLPGAQRAAARAEDAKEGTQRSRPHPAAPGSHAPPRSPLPRAAPIGCGALLRARPARPAGGWGRRGPERAAPPPLPPPPPPGAPHTSGSARRQLPACVRIARWPRRARQLHRGAPARSRAAATTPRAVLRVKNGAAKLPKPPAAAAAAEAPGASAGMERSQSRLSLSASFEALAIYFPCMNSFDDEDAGKRAAWPPTPGLCRDRLLGHPPRWPISSPHPQARSGRRPQGLLSHPGIQSLQDAPSSTFSLGTPGSFAFTSFSQVGPSGHLALALPAHLHLLSVPCRQVPACVRTAHPGSDPPPSLGVLCVPALPTLGSGRLTPGAPTRPPPSEVARSLYLYSFVLAASEAPCLRPLPWVKWGPHGLERLQVFLFSFPVQTLDCQRTARSWPGGSLSCLPGGRF